MSAVYGWEHTLATSNHVSVSYSNLWVSIADLRTTFFSSMSLSSIYIIIHSGHLNSKLLVKTTVKFLLYSKLA